MVTEEELDNLLVKQKNRIINQIDNAKSSERLHTIHSSLSILRPLWKACNYEYKYQELCERLFLKNRSFRNASQTINEIIDGQ